MPDQKVAALPRTAHTDNVQTYLVGVCVDLSKLDDTFGGGGNLRPGSSQVLAVATPRGWAAAEEAQVSRVFEGSLCHAALTW